MIPHQICPYASSGCNSPEGECLGVCCADSRGHTVNMEPQEIGVMPCICEFPPEHGCGAPCNKTTNEPQAQAGEPEAVRCNPADYCSARHSQLIPLQSHREAMAKQKDNFWEVLALREDLIAKKDAALKACVEALEAVSRTVDEIDDYANSKGSSIRDVVDGAINQGREAL